ncbi:MFS family permease [Inhella inkyongensis]|uniref:MFS family permease n=1 Tax=Inhella inkyongensis TaxID=392593 RepID=A0A840S1G1_9BURK|nr:MFS transporter [Inhella inkyongensis]MBB5203593.1 MFS family permease [Inhella inkyongensis]
MSALPAGFVRLIAAMMAIHAVMAVARFTGIVWLLQQGHGAFWVGVLMALISLTPALLAGPAGAWADRYGLWRPLVGGAGLAALGVGAALLQPSLATLCAAALGSGAAIALAAVAVQREIALIARASSAHSQALYSWAAMGPALSNTLSPVLAGYVIEHMGFRPALALSFVLAPLAVWLLRHERHSPHPGQTTGSLLPAFDLLRNPSLRSLLLLNMVFAVSWDAHSFVVPVLGHERGYSASTIGLLLGSFALAVALVRLLIVRFAGRWSEAQSLRAALGICIAVLASYRWLPGVVGMAMGSFLLGLALGSVQPTLLAGLTRVTPHERHGQAFGLRMLFTNASSVLMPVSFGGAAALLGTAAPLWLMAACGLMVWPLTRER